MASLPIIPVADRPTPSVERTPASTGADFGDQLVQMLEQVESATADADTEAMKLSLGAGNLHETAIAMEKADIAVRTLVRVRNRAVEAYQEIMRMTV